MRGWFVSDDGMLMMRVSSIAAIWNRGDTQTWVASVTGSDDSVFHISASERHRLIAQIEAEDVDIIAAKEQMFHHDGGGFLLSDVRGYKIWSARAENDGVPALDQYINVHFGGGDSAWHTPIHGSDIPRFLDAMGVLNEQHV